MRSFKSNENIHKKEGGSYYVVSATKASSVTLQSPGKVIHVIYHIKGISKRNTMVQFYFQLD